MIRLLVRFANWLDTRFPEKVVVTEAAWTARCEQVSRLVVEVDLLRDEMADLKASHDATVDRVAHLEASAVHKGAVSDLVAHVKQLKEEMISLKASLGWNVSA